MSKISSKKKEKIKEEILRILYENSPMAVSTFYISEEIARDNEFILGLLNEMKKMGLVHGLGGKNCKKKIRMKWRLKDRTFQEYKKLVGVGKV